MKGEAFIKLPRDLLESEAFGSLGPTSFRVLRFLMIEHMRQGGKRNGFLLAPRRQLVAFGVRPHDISASINQLERVGLVDCRRGIGRRPSEFTLTWLPLSDGTEPNQRWRECSGEAAAIATGRKRAKSRIDYARQPAVASTQTALTRNECCLDTEMNTQTALTKPVASDQTALTTGGPNRTPLLDILTRSETTSITQREGTVGLRLMRLRW